MDVFKESCRILICLLLPLLGFLSKNQVLAAPNSCDFEDGKCGWICRGWIQTNGQNGASISGRLIYDHTKGKYKHGHFMKTYHDQDYMDTPILMSPRFSSDVSSDRCLSFWFIYYLKYDHEFLKVLVSNNGEVNDAHIIANIGLDRTAPTKWTEYTVFLPNQSKAFQIIFLVSKSHGNLAEVGIDDVQLWACEGMQKYRILKESPNSSNTVYDDVKDTTLFAILGGILCLIVTILLVALIKLKRTNANIKCSEEASAKDNVPVPTQTITDDMDYTHLYDTPYEVSENDVLQKVCQSPPYYINQTEILNSLQESPYEDDPVPSSSGTRFRDFKGDTVAVSRCIEVTANEPSNNSIVPEQNACNSKCLDSTYLHPIFDVTCSAESQYVFGRPGPRAVITK